jgi:hypothetical protein
MTEELSEGLGLHWHALNYRTAGVLQADAQWKELEKYVDGKISAAIEERDTWQQEYMKAENRANAVEVKLCAVAQQCIHELAWPSKHREIKEAADRITGILLAAANARADKARAVAIEEAAIKTETPYSGEQDDITMKAKDDAAKRIRALNTLPPTHCVVPVDLRYAINALLHQIDIGTFFDEHGHSAKMLKPVHDIMRLLAARK